MKYLNASVAGGQISAGVNQAPSAHPGKTFDLRRGDQAHLQFKREGMQRQKASPII
jgi:hypothetical protein